MPMLQTQFDLRNRWQSPPSEEPIAHRHGQRSRRAKRAIVVGVAVYLIAQVTFNLAIRNDWLPIRDPVYSEKRAFQALHPSTEKPKLLALGSSRTQLGFDVQRFIEKFQAETGIEIAAFNFGCPAAGPMTCNLYLRRLLEQGERIDSLLLEIHPGFISAHEPPYESQWLHGYRLRPEELTRLRSFGWEVPTPPHHGWKGWLVPFYAYRFSILNQYWSKMLPCPFGLTVGSASDNYGFVKAMEIPADRIPKAIAHTRGEYAATLENYTIGGPGPHAIDDLLSLAKEKNIAVTVVLMPESSDFRSWYGDAGNHAISDYALSLQREHGIDVINARHWVPDAGFSDGHHLLPIGSACYSDRLAREWRPAQLLPSVEQP